MNHGFERVLQLLDQPVRLQDVDQTHEDQDPLPLVIPGGGRVVGSQGE